MSRTKYDDLKKQIDSLRKEYIKAAKAALGEESKTLFDKHPKMREFGWVQYTDYFNDGEACRFHAQTYSPYINGANTDYDDDLTESGLTEEEYHAAAKDVRTLLETFDNDTYEHLFGDHVRVTVTKKGATTEEYTDHS